MSKLQQWSGRLSDRPKDATPETLNTILRLIFQFRIRRLVRGSELTYHGSTLSSSSPWCQLHPPGFVLNEKGRNLGLAATFIGSTAAEITISGQQKAFAGSSGDASGVVDASTDARES